MQINGLPSVQAGGLSGIGNILSGLEAGEIIKAKVLEFTEGELLLKLTDGSLFRAEAAEDVEVKAGDTLNLQVGSREDGKLFMKIIKENLAAGSQGTLKPSDIFMPENEAEIKLLLKKLDLPESENNIRTAYQLKGSDNTLSRETISNAAGLIAKFTQLSASNASFLAAKGIEPSQENIISFLKLLNGKLKLGSELTSLISQLSNSADEVSVQAQLKPQQAFASETGFSRTETDDYIFSTKFNTKNENPNESSLGYLKSELESSEGKALTSSSNAGVSVISAKDGNNSSMIFSEKQNTLVISKELLLGTGSSLESASNKELPALLKDIAKETQDLFIKINNSDNAKEVPKNVIKEFLSSLKEKIEKLDKHISVLKEQVEYLSKSEGDKDGTAAAGNLLNTLNSIQDSIKVLNEVNRNICYYQLPINISGHDTTAELYIMKRGSKGKRLDPENTTLFLSLDTLNIGNVQSIIEIKGREVAMNLRLETPEIIDFMKENTSLLHKRLQEEGFRLSNTNFRLISNQTTLSDMEKVVNEETKLRHRILDIKI